MYCYSQLWWSLRCGLIMQPLFLFLKITFHHRKIWNSAKLRHISFFSMMREKKIKASPWLLIKWKFSTYVCLNLATHRHIFSNLELFFVVMKWNNKLYLLYGVLVLKWIIQHTFWVPKNATHILPYFRIPIIHSFVFSCQFAIIMHNYVGTIGKSSYISQINFLTKIITTILQIL